MSPASTSRALATLIERSAAPVQVRMAIERIADAQPSARALLSASDDLASILVPVLAASRALTRLLESDPGAMAVLAALDHSESLLPTTVAELAGWKRREYLRIAARDLSGIADLDATVAAIAALARDVLQASFDLVGVADMPGIDALAVIGMGKLGGNELNYSSDVDVMFVGDGDRDDLERAARQLIDIARRCFRIDTNLRPEGRDGALVRTLDSYEAYWDRWAQPWEFQALLKARPVAGDADLGARFLDTAQRWLWNQPVGADELRHLRQMKERAEYEVTKRGLADREIKRGPGGIRDIEFSAQLLQLVHGTHDEALRSPTTLAVLGELANAGYIAVDDSDSLSDSYRFLRTVEHRLQLLDDQQVHTVPAADDARDHVARILGLRSTPRATALEQFDQQLRLTRLTVRTIHERIYFRPLLEAFAGSAGELNPEAAAARLTAFGFTDAARTKVAVRELTRGLNRSSRLMQQMLPLFLDWLSASPDPDLGLLQLRNLLTGPQRLSQLVEPFRDSPEVARNLCLLLGTSRLVGDSLIRNPDLVARLPYPDRLKTRPLDELLERVEKLTSWREDRADRHGALRRWQERHLLGIQARDLLHGESVARVGADLSTLAETTIAAALRDLGPSLPFAVIALGRFGGASLSYASDLDVVFVYEGEGAAAFEEADRLAKQLLRFVNGEAPSDRIYEIDAALRPEGNQGAMARSLGGYRKYFTERARVWERQAYLRARPVAGDSDLGVAMLEMLEPFVWGHDLSESDVREIRRMKARVEKERIPAGQDTRFHLKLGRGSLSDIEWTAQLLQLQRGVRATDTLQALQGVRDAGYLADDDATILLDTYEFLEHTRNRLYLVNSGPSDSLPTQPEPLMWLARSLGTNAADLREHYRRVTRRTRRVVERVFYDQRQ